VCESKAVIVTGSGEEELMDDVAVLEVRDDSTVVLRDILGRVKEVGGLRLKRIDFVKHVIYFAKP